MSFTFSIAQQAEIKRLFDIANQRVTDLGSANTNYADVYAYIRDQISGYPQLVPAIDSVARWFTAATDANSGVGPVSVLIRSYTEHQAALRGVNITGKMQIASNEVAVNAITSILANGLLPTIDQIAIHDATGVGKILFDPYIPTDSASAAQQNSAWSGSGNQRGQFQSIWPINQTVF